ncbi:MAG: hypothetical protein HKN92_09035 [Chitinophagales bacterium]|nr:hypothetical protein [Chitinophagales bacterium]
MDDSITLQQGLEKFQAGNMKIFSDQTISSEGEEFLKHHDIAHVVFGCDTTIYGEGVVKIWTTFGTTLSFWKVINGYSEANAFELSREYSFQHVIKNIFRFLVVIPKVIYRAKQMSKPWPFSGYKTYLNTSISEIRREFSIQIV